MSETSGEHGQRAIDTLRIIYSSPVCPEHLRIIIRERHGAYPMFDGGPSLMERAKADGGHIGGSRTPKAD